MLGIPTFKKVIEMDDKKKITKWVVTIITIVVVIWMSGYIL